MSIDQTRGKGLILVVEDNPGVARALSEVLGANGYQVDLATSQAQALKKIHRADLTLLDVVLPDGDGLELCRAMRGMSDLARHPIILMSVMGYPTDRARGIEAGADDFLTKPLDVDELLVRVRSLLHTRRIEADLRRHTLRLTALRHLTTIVVDTVDVPDLAQRVANAVPEVFGADSSFVGGLLCTVEAPNQVVRAYAVTDLPITTAALRHLERPLRDYRSSPDSSNLLQQAAREGTVESGEHLVDFISPCVMPSLAKRIERLIGLRGAVAMPVRAQGKLIGVFLFALSKPVAAITPLERELMGDFVDTIGIALENVRLYTEAARLMVTDGLTGVANRRRFDRALTEEVSRAARLSYPVGLILLDVDHFKAYNDRYGHRLGDRVLQAIAQCLEANVRKTDLVSRYGGEEFTIILPGTSAGGVAAIGEKLRQTIHGLEFAGHPDLPPPTISAGGASASAPDLSVDALIQAADTALYQAKNDGRDRVYVLDHPLVESLGYRAV